MATRPGHRRQQDFKPGIVTGWPPHAGDAAEVATRASYVPDGKHKGYPAPNGEWSYFRSTEGTRCPPIGKEGWPQVQEALRAAIEVGVIGGQFRGAFPSRAWVYLNDRLCEARLSNQDTGQYHGFPLDYEEHHPTDPESRLQHAPRIKV